MVNQSQKNSVSKIYHCFHLWLHNLTETEKQPFLVW